MGDVFKVILDQSPSTAILLLIILGMSWFIYSHALPAIQNLKNHEIEKEAWIKERNDLNTIIANHVVNDKTEQLIQELIKTCQATHQKVSELSLQVDDDFEKLAKEVENLMRLYRELIASSDSNMLRRTEGVDANLQLITQQVSIVSHKLSGITGLLVGNQHRAALELMGSEFKDLK
jgi:hypothetical protein